MSAEALADVEGRIKTEFDAFTDAVLSDDAEAVCASADVLLALINERNQTCKAGK